MSLSKSLFVRISAVVALVLFCGVGALTPTTPAPVHASASQCPDPIEGWYGCWQKYSVVSGYVNTWCSLADPKKAKSGTSPKEDCVAFLRKSINYKPAGIASGYQCGDVFKAVQNGDCYVQISPTLNNGDWYTALGKFSTACSFDPSSSKNTRECREGQWNAFLTAHKFNAANSTTTGPSAGAITDPKQSPFATRITTYIRWLVAGIGILGVFSMVIAGLQYAAAQGNPQSVAAAKGRIVNVVIGILIYVTMFGLLQWLIPGGVF